MSSCCALAVLVLCHYLAGTVTQDTTSVPEPLNIIEFDANGDHALGSESCSLPDENQCQEKMRRQIRLLGPTGARASGCREGSSPCKSNSTSTRRGRAPSELRHLVRESDVQVLHWYDGRQPPGFVRVTRDSCGGKRGGRLGPWGRKSHVIILCGNGDDCRSSRDEILRLHALVHDRATAETEEELLSVLVLTPANLGLRSAEYDGSLLDRRLAYVAHGPHFWFPVGFADPKLWDATWAQIASSPRTTIAVTIQDGVVAWRGAVETITTSLLETWLYRGAKE